MPLTHANIIDKIEMLLQDSSNAIFAAATELNDRLQDALRDFARYRPHIVRVPYTVESRTGTATSTTASALVDATEVQFLAGDVGKVIHNTTDNTWAIVTAYVSTSQLTLSRDIMVSGESYEMYNKDCTSNKQINIEDVEDYLWVEKLEFPIGTEREVDSIHGSILTIGIDDNPDDTKDADADKIVHVYFAKRHKVSQLTDLAAAVNNGAGYSESDTSIVLDALQDGTATIEEDQEFTIAGMRQIYTVTADATIGTNAATIYFYPGLEGAVLDNAVVTFTLSTLDRILEDLIASYVAALASMSKSTAYIDKVTKGGANVSGGFMSWGEREFYRIKAELMSLAKPAVAKSLSRQL